MCELFKKAEIKAIASILPSKEVDLEQLPIGDEKNKKKIINTTGIKFIRKAKENRTTVDYCCEVGEYLLENQKIDRELIDGIVFVSQTPDYIMPASSCLLQNKLNLRKNLVAFDINYGCSGYVYGLFQAFLLIETGVCSNVLVFTGDTMTRHVNEKDRALMMVLGDAASVTLVGKADNDNLSMFSFYTDGAGYDKLIIPAGSNRIPIKKGVTDLLVEDEDGNSRSQENLYMNGLEIMTFSSSVVPKLIKNCLTKIDWDIRSLDKIFLHQPNKFIVNFIAKKLKLTEKEVPVYLEKIGNTGPASIPLMLSGLYSNNSLEKVLLCGFGVGLSAASLATTMKNAKILPILDSIE